MTSAVIIVLREVLEAMLLICTLMASLKAMRLGLLWLPYGIAAGFIGAFFYAAYLDEISMMLGGFGQEVVNAVLLIGVSLLLACHNFMATNHYFNGSHLVGALVLRVLMALAVGMAITREGSEIYLYVYAYGYLAGATSSVLSGAIIGVGIGFSTGTFIYYGLRMLSWQRCLQLCCFVALIVAAGMMSQGVLYLSQADIVPVQEPLWDSTAFIAESSLLGELLRAVIGYEASPTLTQLGFYLLSMVITAVAMVLGRFAGRVTENRMLSRITGFHYRRAVISALVAFSYSGAGVADVESQHNGVNRVYPPYVTALEQELEVRSIYQTDNTPTEDNILHQNISFGTAINARVFTELGLNGKKVANGPLRLEGYEVETRVQLTEQGQYAADWGVLLEIERERSESITEAAVALLVSRQWGDWIGTVNVGMEYEFGSDIANEFDTTFAGQWRYRYKQGFEPGVELYVDEFTRGAGPVISGVIRGNANRKWRWESGLIFPLNDTTPDVTFRFLLEYEF